MSDDSSKSNDLSWWEGLCAAAGSYLMSVALTAAISRSFLADTDSISRIAIIQGISSVAMLVFAGLYLYVRGTNFRNFFGRTKLKWLYLTPFFYLVYLGISTASQQLIDLLPWVDISQKQDLGLENFVGSDLPLIFVSLVLLPPLAEEVVFRGILYRSFRRPLGKIAAALVTSAIFGAAHGQWNVATDTFVLSLILIFVVEKSKSLWPAILLHALKNFIAYLLVFVFRLG